MTYEDDRTPPAWRDAGEITIQADSCVALADPCYGALIPVEGILAPGRWLWQVRDGEADGSRAREWEVRLVRDDVLASDDWDWLDAYGNIADIPALPAGIAGTMVDFGVRGVDSGTMTWCVYDASEPTPHAPADWADLPTAGAVVGGHYLTTHTGWGDGGYPVAGRLIDDTLVEVRICFITPAPDTLTASAFSTLCRQALAASSAGDPATGALTLEVLRYWYEARRDGGLATTEIDTVIGAGVEGVLYLGANSVGQGLETQADTDGRPIRHDADLVGRLAALWTRLPAGEREQLIAGQAITDVHDEGSRGQITRSRSSNASVLLRLQP